MPLIILGVYALVGLTHEVAGLRFWDVVRRVTKCLLMPVLIVYYCVRADGPLIVAIIAIVMSWIGDVILLGKDNNNLFRLGMAAFLLSHVFYIITLVGLTHSWHIPALIVSIVVALALVVVMPRIINPPKMMRIPIIIYSVAISAMSVCALQYALSAWTATSITLFVGSLVFLFADALLAYLTFGRKPKYFNAITMLPYIIAQVLIVIGLAAA